MIRMANWHTKKERKLIKRFKGKPLVKYGYDGKIRNKPVEVRDQRKDKRFRIQKDVHKHLVRNDGFYILDTPGEKPVKMTAKEVSKKIGKGKWLKDRKYPHKFLRRNQVW